MLLQFGLRCSGRLRTDVDGGNRTAATGEDGYSQGAKSYLQLLVDQGIALSTNSGQLSTQGIRIADGFVSEPSEFGGFQKLFQFFNWEMGE